MSEARRVAAALLHDVGKYVARTARNVPADRIEGPFASMLLKDVYETHRGARASARFAELAAELERAGVRDARVGAVREALGRIDALEARARAGEAAALVALEKDALVFVRSLRGLARDTVGVD
jgi:hypothetical protein